MSAISLTRVDPASGLADGSVTSYSIASLRQAFLEDQPMATMSNESQASRWKGTLRRTLLLLAVWLIAGPVCGILIVDRLNAFRIGSLPLGFWIALQGSIYVFVVLIFLNAFLADRADRA